jgi:hypothetical protein
VTCFNGTQCNAHVTCINGTQCNTHVTCFTGTQCNAHVTPFRIAPEGVHTSHFRSSCNVALMQCNRTIMVALYQYVWHGNTRPPCFRLMFTPRWPRTAHIRM